MLLGVDAAVDLRSLFGSLPAAEAAAIAFKRDQTEDTLRAIVIHG